MEMCYHYQHMGNYERKQHKPGVVIYHVKGNLEPEDITRWREDIEAFVKENAKRGACGILIDANKVDSFSVSALDGILALLAEPEDVIADVRTRFALMGIKRHTQRFLRSAMPIVPLKHVRARFFHETARDEALAWLSAMVESAEDLPKPSVVGSPDEKPKEDKKRDKVVKVAEVPKADEEKTEEETKKEATPEEKRASLKAKIKS
jgi:hypothetical protein